MSNVQATDDGRKYVPPATYYIKDQNNNQYLSKDTKGNLIIDPVAYPWQTADATKGLSNYIIDKDGSYLRDNGQGYDFVTAPSANCIWLMLSVSGPSQIQNNATNKALVLPYGSGTIQWLCQLKTD